MGHLLIALASMRLALPCRGCGWDRGLLGRAWIEGWLTNNGKQITQTKGPDNSKPMTPTWECAALILTEPSTDRVSVRD